MSQCYNKYNKLAILQYIDFGILRMQSQIPELDRASLTHQFERFCCLLGARNSPKQSLLLSLRPVRHSPRQASQLKPLSKYIPLSCDA
jgi:hypothetical protein